MSPHRNRPSRILYATRALAAAALVFGANLLHASDKTAPPAKPATEYAAHDTHPDEHVTIAAEPCDDTRNCPFFRLKYLEHGLMPIRVIITNDSDHVLSLDQARMQFISADNDKLPAATTDDINRRLFTIKNAQGTKIPIIPITVHHPVDKKILDDDRDFGFKTTTVQPHSTLAGYLIYDVKQLDEPALAHAELYVKMIHTKEGDQELFAFSIPFDKWLAANPDAPSNHPRK
ncbi:MAG TPA: hypothetical protein VHU44_08755 [Acidobacteriaceae bacterium]|jgi:hypothetical protein|nr:hypothetical protein [Acidobacteriaceae bacterium]